MLQTSSFYFVHLAFIMANNKQFTCKCLIHHLTTQLNHEHYK